MTRAPSASAARLAVLLVGLGLVVAIVAIAALFLGSARVPPGDVLAVLTGRVRGVDQAVVLNLRLPRILAALLAGGALAVGRGFRPSAQSWRSPRCSASRAARRSG
jgi:iron complex transport system permease protein